MHVKSRLALAGAVAVLGLALNQATALASNPHNLIKADFTPSQPDDAKINEVSPGGAPWILDRGEVRVRDNGRIDVRLEGLQIPGSGPNGEDANPVASITASLYCDGATTASAVSSVQPLSRPDGDARFRETLAVPDSCGMAVVLINPGNPARYIASAVADMDDDD
jgi:hypothetical protein